MARSSKLSKQKEIIRHFSKVNMMLEERRERNGQSEGGTGGAREREYIPLHVITYPLTYPCAPRCAGTLAPWTLDPRPRAPPSVPSPGPADWLLIVDSTLPSPHPSRSAVNSRLQGLPFDSRQNAGDQQWHEL
jgi:hypothetical protein